MQFHVDAAEVEVAPRDHLDDDAGIDRGGARTWRAPDGSARELAEVGLALSLKAMAPSLLSSVS